jgi:hypothetical protein
MSSTNETIAWKDWPAYWLVALETAVSAGDFIAAANAQDQLRRLGFEVNLRHVPKTQHHVSEITKQSAQFLDRGFPKEAADER